MKGKDIPAIRAIKKSHHNVIKIPQQSMKVKEIPVMAAIINKDGKSILKCTT